MNHAITIGGLLLFVLAVVGALIIGTGALIFMAGGNAPVPDERMGRQGCVMLAVGGILLALAIWGLAG